MNTKASTDALLSRLKGEQVSRFRALTMAGTAGAGIAVVVYRSLRN